MSPIVRRTLLLALLAASCTSDKDNTAPPPGDPRSFDPIASYAAYAAYAGPDARLLSLHAHFVRVDGTMDLAADYHPHLDAEFVTVATPDDVQRQGPLAPGSGFVAGDPLRTAVQVHAQQTYHVVRGAQEWDERHLGMERTPGARSPGGEPFAEPPRCGLAQLWQQALAQGAPGDVVANIRYDRDGYTFVANGREFQRRFDVDCKPLP